MVRHCIDLHALCFGKERGGLSSFATLLVHRSSFSSRVLAEEGISIDVGIDVGKVILKNKCCFSSVFLFVGGFRNLKCTSPKN